MVDDQPALLFPFDFSPSVWRENLPPLTVSYKKSNPALCMNALLCCSPILTFCSGIILPSAALALCTYTHTHMHKLHLTGLLHGPSVLLAIHFRAAYLSQVSSGNRDVSAMLNSFPPATFHRIYSRPVKSCCSFCFIPVYAPKSPPNQYSTTYLSVYILGCKRLSVFTLDTLR